MPKKTKILCILDGFGLSAEEPNNALYAAHTPTFNYLFETYPWTTLDADGDAVGQETGLVGNSEVGHMNIGALKLVPQVSYQITYSATTAFQNITPKNPNQVAIPQNIVQAHTAQYTNTRYHICGLFSTGTIHSDLRHWIAAIEAVGEHTENDIILHLISDGRDSDKSSFADTWKLFTTTYLQRLAPYIHRLKLGSIGGRYYAMDRDTNWDRTEKGLYAMITSSEVESNELFRSNYEDIEGTITTYTNSQYSQNIYDEHLIPIQTHSHNGLQKNDLIWCINFRTDRIKQFIEKLCEYNVHNELHCTIIGMNNYGTPSFEAIAWNSQLSSSSYFAIFHPLPVTNTLSEYIASQHQTQLHIAETEKYNHVTYFLNGGQDVKQDGEDWKLIPSDKITSYAQKPEMKAKEITDYIISKGLGVYDYIIVNYANPDMVGHTGDFDAAVQSMEFLDTQIHRIVQECEQHGHQMIITADHGNIEKVGEYHTHEGKTTVDTEHNANPVPCIFVTKNWDESTMIENANALLSTRNQSHIPTTLSYGRYQPKAQWLTEVPHPQIPLWYCGLFIASM